MATNNAEAIEQHIPIPIRDALNLVENLEGDAWIILLAHYLFEAFILLPDSFDLRAVGKPHGRFFAKLFDDLLQISYESGNRGISISRVALKTSFDYGGHRFGHLIGIIDGAGLTLYYAFTNPEQQTRKIVALAIDGFIGKQSV